MLRVVSDIQAGQDITRAIKEFGSSAPAPSAGAKNAPLKDVALAGVGFEHIVGVPVLSNLSIAFRAGRSLRDRWLFRFGQVDTFGSFTWNS